MLVADGQTNLPNDAYHSSLRGSAQSAADDYSVRPAILFRPRTPHRLDRLRRIAGETGRQRRGLFGAAQLRSNDRRRRTGFGRGRRRRQPPKSRSPAPVAEDGYAKGDPQTCRGCHSGDARIVAFLKLSPMAVKGDPKTPMAQGGCESCHGPSAAHVASRSKGGDGEPGVVFKGPNASPVAERNAVCLGCHESGMRMNWQGSQMSAPASPAPTATPSTPPKDPVLVKETQPQECFTCHAEQRADSFKYSHHPIREGKVVCSDCHNPIGSPGPKLLKEFTVNETCYNCHAEKRGPMLWEHQPVRENCLNCHTPHGSNQPRLMTSTWASCAPAATARLRTQRRRVRRRATRARHRQGTAPINSALANQRLCLNCHSQIHGSNSPNGAYFLR